MIISDIIYQDGLYWIYQNDGLFVCCKDEPCMGYAIPFGTSDTFNGAKEIIKSRKEQCQKH